MSGCAFFFHTYHWGDVTVVSQRYVQYGRCKRCGITRMREVLLG